MDAYPGIAYTNYHKTATTSDQAGFTLPTGSYRFRADRNSTQFWSGTENHCALPGCTATGVAP